MKLIFIILTSIFTLFSSLSHSEISSDDIEVVTVYGTSYEMDSLWELLSFEYEYPYAQFELEYEILKKEDVLKKACDTANNNKPDGCLNKPSKLKKPRTNGCSNSPDGSFSNACNSHDVCYDNLSSTKNACDTNFKDDLYDSCDDSSPRYAMNKICKGTANLYYSAVVIAGKSSYYKGQKEAQCASWWALYDTTCGKLND